ncbi:MAG: hypothetical protein ACPLKQ_04275 [Candidatus Bathyarchaeales archaeon]
MRVRATLIIIGAIWFVLSFVAALLWAPAVVAYDYGYGPASIIYTSQWGMTYDDNMRAQWAASEIYNLFAARGHWEIVGWSWEIVDWYWDEYYQEWMPIWDWVPIWGWVPVYSKVENFHAGIYEWRVRGQAQHCEQEHPFTAVFYHGHGAKQNITNNISGPFRYNIYNQDGSPYWVGSIDCYNSGGAHAYVQNPQNLIGWEANGYCTDLYAEYPGDYAWIIGKMRGLLDYAGYDRATGHIVINAYSEPGYSSDLYVYVSDDHQNWYLVNTLTITNTSPCWIYVGAHSGPFRYIAIAVYVNYETGNSAYLHVDAVHAVTIWGVPPPGEHPWTIDDYEDIYPYTAYNHRFVFLWACMQGDEVGGYTLGYNRGMPYAWSHRTTLSTNGYDYPDTDPDDNYVFIGFENISKTLSEWPTPNNNYKYWLVFFYYAALSEGRNIKSALDRASELVWGPGTAFDDTPLYNGYWGYNPAFNASKPREYPTNWDWWWSKMRVYGNGNMYLPT